MRLLIIFLSIALLGNAGAELFAELPSVLEYQSGTKIANYTVVEWKETSVIVKRGQGGPFPVNFSTLIPEQREIFEAEASTNADSIEIMKAQTQANAIAQSNLYKAKSAAAARKKELEKECKVAIDERRVLVGMTVKQVIESIGKPSKINTSVRSGGRKHVQWVYTGRKNKPSFVYFRDGLVSSFTVSSKIRR